MRNVALTLYEGDHVQGLGPLINSLHRAGFRGVVLVGHRGSLPWWLPANGRDGGGWAPADGLELRFVELPAGIAANQLKPWLLVRALDSPELQGGVSSCSMPTSSCSHPFPISRLWSRPRPHSWSTCGFHGFP